MQVTLNAKSKILNLLESKDSIFRISCKPGSELTLNLTANAELCEFDVTISSMPRIVVDVSTLTQFVGKNVDFDYQTNEFIIA